jgi:hypothetical protein
MLVGSRQRLQQSSSNPQIVIGNHIIQQVSSKKVLGVIIDEQLKWEEHNDAQCTMQNNFPVNCSLEKRKTICKSRYMHFKTCLINALVYLISCTYCSNAIWVDAW